MAFEYRHRRRVEFSDTDMAGIMHFSRFFIFMEATEHAFFRSLGFSIHSRIQDEYYGWPRIGVECEFKKPLKFEDEVEIHLKVLDISSKTIQYQFTFRKVEGEKPEDYPTMAEGFFRVICVQKNKSSGIMRSVSIPKEIREKIDVAP